jgi:hypothetical protein
MNRHLAALAAVATMVLGPTMGLCDTQMLHCKSKVAEPKQPPGSFQDQPKEYWRIGTTAVRILEAVDPKTKVQQLAIAVPPDVWTIDLSKKEGVHVVLPKVPAPLPVFPGQGAVAQKLLGLNYGSELSFFQSRSAKKTAGQSFNGHPADLYVVPIDATMKLSLLADPKTNKPMRIAVTDNKGKSVAVDYLLYETLPADMSLFKPPQGVKIVDAKIATARVPGKVPAPKSSSRGK